VIRRDTRVISDEIPGRGGCDLKGEGHMDELKDMIPRVWFCRVLLLSSIPKHLKFKFK
jgi:hypothetical protein